jgi:AraC-like DNA-binding protein
MGTDALGRQHATGINDRYELDCNEETIGSSSQRHVYRISSPPCNKIGNTADEPGTQASTHGFAPSKRLMRMVEHAQDFVERNAHDETLSVTRLASALNMSRTSLHRKFVIVTGNAPGDFIREVRLEIAHRLLSNGSCNVSQAAYAIGFVSLSGFSRAYRARYGAPPSHLLQQSGK